MCGIFGTFNSSGSGTDESLLERAIAAVSHRGPDERGVYSDERVGLAHARLSIIDLAGGRQPMSNEDDTVWVTFNGEIFNYIELRRELVARGHVFKTDSDTEVLVHLWEDEGENCVRRLNGQWAFAIWDTRRRRLFLSRDRLGIRPLYYHVRSGACGETRLCFASEIKSLFASPDVPRRLSVAALDQIFTYWAPIAPATIFEGVHELAPAHDLVVEGDRVDSRRYWDITPEPGETRSEADLVEEIRALLEDATALRLRSDVPVGAYLSGGLDSTVTTALVRAATAGTLRTFSVSFEDKDYDESPFQRLAAEHFGVEHHEVRCGGTAICDVFPEVVRHAEKPILRTAPAPLFLLSNLVNECGFKVVVTGEGADEVMGGYDIFKELKIREFWAKDLESNMRPKLLRRLYPYMPALQSQPTEYLKAFFRVSPEDLASPYFSHLPRWETTSMAKRFFSEDVRARLADGRPTEDALQAMLPAEFSRWASFARAQYLESALLLPGYILSSQGDRMAMAHSVEGRFPFLDHRLSELMFRVPANLKMRGLDEKHLLKRAAGELIPKRIVERKKQPYRAPDAASFFDPSSGAARADWVEDVLSAEKLREHGVFDEKAVAALIRKARAGRAIGTKDNMAVVGVLSTQLLMEQFINNRVFEACQRTERT